MKIRMKVGLGVLVAGLVCAGCDIASNIANDNDNSNNNTTTTTNISVTNGDGTVDVYGTNTNGVYGFIEKIPAGK